MLKLIDLCIMVLLATKYGYMLREQSREVSLRFLRHPFSRGAVEKYWEEIMALSDLVDRKVTQSREATDTFADPDIGGVINFADVLARGIDRKIAEAVKKGISS
jgi:hypothetical protein